MINKEVYSAVKRIIIDNYQYDCDEWLLDIDKISNRDFKKFCYLYLMNEPLEKRCHNYIKKKIKKLIDDSLEETKHSYFESLQEGSYND